MLIQGSGCVSRGITQTNWLEVMDFRLSSCGNVRCVGYFFGQSLRSGKLQLQKRLSICSEMRRIWYYWWGYFETDIFSIWCCYLGHVLIRSRINSRLIVYNIRSGALSALCLVSLDPNLSRLHGKLNNTLFSCCAGGDGDLKLGTVRSKMMLVPSSGIFSFSYGECSVRV